MNMEEGESGEDLDGRRRTRRSGRAVSTRRWSVRIRQRSVRWWRRHGIEAHVEEERVRGVNLTAVWEAVGEDPTAVKAVKERAGTWVVVK
jgi:hypothetical protein